MTTALVTLQEAKDYLNIKNSTYDSLLSSLILQASARVVNYCNREFVIKVYEEIYTGDGTFRLCLDHFPIVDVYYLSQDITKDERKTNNLIKPTQFLVRPDVGFIELYNDIFMFQFGQYQGFYSGVYNSLYNRNIYIKYAAGYDVTPEDVQGVVKDIISRKYYAITEKRFGIQSKGTMGDQVVFTSSDLSQDNKSILDSYRKPPQAKGMDVTGMGWTVES